MRQAQTLRKGLGNEGRLIVSALSLALTVERNRDDDIACEPVVLATYDFSKLLRKPGAQRLDLLKLQQKDCPDERSLINREAACAIEAVCLVLTSGAEELFFFQLQPGKRASTKVASGCGDPFERSEAFRANRHTLGMHEEFATDPAIRWKDYADERVTCYREQGA